MEQRSRRKKKNKNQTQINNGKTYSNISNFIKANLFRANSFGSDYIHTHTKNALKSKFYKFNQVAHELKKKKCSTTNYKSQIFLFLNC